MFAVGVELVDPARVRVVVAAGDVVIPIGKNDTIYVAIPQQLLEIGLTP